MDKQNVTDSGPARNQDPNFAEGLIREYRGATLDLSIAGPGGAAERRYNRAYADLMHILTVPAPKDPDDEFLRDQIYIALLPAAVAAGNRSERTPIVEFVKDAWRNSGLAMAARKGGVA